MCEIISTYRDTPAETNQPIPTHPPLPPPQEIVN